MAWDDVKGNEILFASDWNDMVTDQKTRSGGAFAVFTDGDATPDVSGSTLYTTANTGPTTITDFDSPSATGQMLIIVFGDVNTTIQASASIVLQGGQASPANDFGPAAVLDTLTLVYDGTRWVEISRSFNS